MLFNKKRPVKDFLEDAPLLSNKLRLAGYILLFALSLWTYMLWYQDYLLFRAHYASKLAGEFNVLRMWFEDAIGDPAALAAWALIASALYARVMRIVCKYNKQKSVRFMTLALLLVSILPLSSALLDNWTELTREPIEPDEILTYGYAELAPSVAWGLWTVRATLTFIAAIFAWLMLASKESLRACNEGLLAFSKPWYWLLGYRFIPWGELLNVSLEGKGKKRSLSIKTKNQRYRLNWQELVNEGKSDELLESLQNHAASAMSQSGFERDPALRDDYTELWLKYFSSSQKRERSGFLKAGEKLAGGRYEVAGELGQGGQGTAYLACEHQVGVGANDGHAIVLKEYILPLHKGEAIFAQSLSKLNREAEILSKIKHPNIVELKDTFVEDHRGYLVLEYVEGSSLKDLVENQGALPENQVIEIALQVLAVLEYLHNMDPPVIHRDLTPDNLILSAEGKIKLVDFNVAQQLESSGTATVVGKHAYIPSEQFRGKPLPASDIYALAASMHFFLTGIEPEPLTVCHPARLNEQVSMELSEIVARATSLEYFHRYESAAAMSEALSEFARKKGLLLSAQEQK